jgi:hypothetical protein
MRGGDNPKLPILVSEFPIRDEATLRKAFPCFGDEPTGIDFMHERVDVIIDFHERIFDRHLAWVAVVEEQLVFAIKRGPRRGGVTPVIYATLVVVPKDAPKPTIRECSMKQSRGGPPRI